MKKDWISGFILTLSFSALAGADSLPTIPQQVLDRPEFFSKIDVIENLELLENVNDRDLETASKIADLPEITAPDKTSAGGSDE